jgi:hypothetical protein
MLRIVHGQTKAGRRWTLCGQLTGPWVAELRKCWDYGRPTAGDTHTVVDLSDVTFIDETGEELLLQMRNQGAEFVAAGVETKYLLKNLTAKGERPLRRFIGPSSSDSEKSRLTKREDTK